MIRITPIKVTSGKYLNISQYDKDSVLRTTNVNIKYDTKREGHYYIYKNWIYKTDRKYTAEEAMLLIMDLEDKERQKFERLKKKLSVAREEETQPKRERISEEVRVAVWRRDKGKCVKCDSREKLEYDHIVPVSKGGSNTVRNIELLCESCNRKKHDKIE